MSQRNRIVLGIVILVVLAGIILAVETVRRNAAQPVAAGELLNLPPGSIPVRVNGETMGYFTPDDLNILEQVSFVDNEEGKTQEGWLLRDVILLNVEEPLTEECVITVASSSKEKSIQLTWPEIADEVNMIMFDLSGRGTLKLVSLLERLDVRDEWVQDVDSIDVVCP